MAEIIVKFDTTEKTLSATIDGQELPNIQGAYFSQSWRDDDDFCCELTQLEKNEEQNFNTITRIVASESQAGKQEKDAPVHRTLAGFKVVAAGSRLEDDVRNFFKSEG